VTDIGEIQATKILKINRYLFKCKLRWISYATFKGNPVSTNCTSLPDRARCASDCQRLVRAMSNQVNPLLVQTLVLSATKTLVCQRFNSSAKVPLPRIHIASPIGWRQEERNMRTTDPRWLAGFYRYVNLKKCCRIPICFQIVGNNAVYIHFVFF